MTDAASIWAGLIFAILLAIIAVGFYDLVCSARGAMTVTQWLRANPGWLFYPWAVLQFWLFLLAFHVFLQAR